ncbi:hypothetical protein CAL7102_04822 [Dulcicalothrix desertica PCC 7102]|jgi:hypothetical protein|nr:hypothetical protein CAL7102_04822 [Dulcicalothrix desertica PCC 7102]
MKRIAGLIFFIVIVVAAVTLGLNWMRRQKTTRR